MCTFRLTLQRAGTTKGAQGLGARIYHGRYVAPPHGWPATGAYDKYFFPTPRPEPPEKQRQHARDDTNALPSLGHQDRARVRPDQDLSLIHI